jgi:predicted ester cyclase
MLSAMGNVWSWSFQTRRQSSVVRLDGTSCADQALLAAARKGDSLSLEESKALVRDFIDNHLMPMVRGEEHDMGAYLAPDVTYHTAWITPQDDHTDTLYAEGAALGSTFRDIELRVDRMVAEDDLVTAHWSASVHHHGTFPHAAGDIEPTSRQMEVGGLSLYRLRDGRIIDIWVYSNVWDAVRSGALA